MTPTSELTLPAAPGDVPTGMWGIDPSWMGTGRQAGLYNCPKHGSHRDWMQFRWSALAGFSNIYCLRCFADTLEHLPGVVVVPGSGPGAGTGPGTGPGTGGGGGGGGGGGTVAPTLTFTASMPSVIIGGSATLTWGSQNALQLIASGGWSGSQQLPNGTADTGPLMTATTFTLTAVGPGGSITRSVTIGVTYQPPTSAPAITFTSSAPSVTSGGSVSLTWIVANSSAQQAVGGWSGALAATGSQSSGPLTATTTFTINATGPGGSATKSITITVAPVAYTVAVTASLQGGTAPSYEFTCGFSSRASPFGSRTPTTLPNGATIVELVSSNWLVFFCDLKLCLPNTGAQTQLNQFNAIQVVDDTGSLRTFTAAAAVFSFDDSGVNWNQWVWGNGTHPVMQTNGKVYTFTIT